MVLSLESGRPLAASARLNLFALVLDWAATAKAARKRRRTLKVLLTMDDARLNDIGLERQDLYKAMRTMRDGLRPELEASRARHAATKL